MAKTDIHTCGDAPYTDMETLHKQTALNSWTWRIFSSVINSCISYEHRAHPSTQGLIAFLYRIFQWDGHWVIVEHFYLHDTRVLQAIDVSFQYSSAAVASIALFCFAVIALNDIWMSPIKSSESIVGDIAFNKDQFLAYLTKQRVSCMAVPARRHCKKPAKTGIGSFEASSSV